jgi:hypothetical protein
MIAFALGDKAVRRNTLTFQAQYHVGPIPHIEEVASSVIYILLLRRGEAHPLFQKMASDISMADFWGFDRRNMPGPWRMNNPWREGKERVQ